jgi:hypothetical protein
MGGVNFRSGKFDQTSVGRKDGVNTRLDKLFRNDSESKQRLFNRNNILKKPFEEKEKSQSQQKQHNDS